MSPPTGVPYDGPGPQAGDKVAVVGVAFDDSLNVRSGPGVAHEIVTTLPPTATGIGVQGGAQLFPSSLWYEVDANSVIGWVNASYIALVGATDDATSEVVAGHGSIPSGDTMLALGAIVAGSFIGEDTGSRVVVTVAPSVGSLGEITYDVLGLADDANLGFRLHIFGQQDQSAGPFSLHSVERTSLCWRGVTDDGFCI
ncbi:MAG: SH3 domain-containing protein [Actinomycetota bacterium]|nr:SH3 domain-containing protein [Actinomycetota bacterium]